MRVDRAAFREGGAVETQAPARIDLAGGTLDIWPLYLFHQNSQTINVAIDRYARCCLRTRRDGAIELISLDLRKQERFSSIEALIEAKQSRLPLLARLVAAFARTEQMTERRSRRASEAIWSRGLALETRSEVPAGSGLGGSSALNIAVCGALNRFADRRLSARRLIEVARNVEAQVLGVPTGEQDYYAAMYGGVQSLHLTIGGVWREKLSVPAAEIESRFVLCYTGQSRDSGINNWQVQKAHLDGSRAVLRHFDRIATVAEEMRAALAAREWGAVAALVNRDWEARKRNWPKITTPTIERLMKIAGRAGAVAAKACGAGGGGCVVLMTAPEDKERVEATVRAAGARVISFRVSSLGLQVHAPRAA